MMKLLIFTRSIICTGFNHLTGKLLDNDVQAENNECMFSIFKYTVSFPGSSFILGNACKARAGSGN